MIMADKKSKVGVDFYVRNKSQQGLRGFQSDMARAQRQLAGMFKGMAVAIGLHQITAGFRSIIEATMEQEKAERKKRCTYARDRLDRYHSSRIYEPQADGSRRFLSDSERKAAIEKLEKQVRKWCG